MMSRKITFRCPTKLYNELLENSENKTKIIVSALESYQSKEFRDNLLNAYLQLNNLFKQIGKHFSPEFGRSKIDINQLAFYIKDYIKNADAIDSINKTLGVD
jgi:hypothetical protein